MVELDAGQVRDPFKRQVRADSVKQVHADCDGYKNPARAKAAIKAKREAMRNAALKPLVDQALNKIARAERSMR
jgi:hypothetical protein